MSYQFDIFFVFVKNICKIDNVIAKKIFGIISENGNTENCFYNV